MYPKGRPYCQKSDPAPPEIGRGSKRALTHPPENLTASREAAGEPPRRGIPPALPRGGFKRARCPGRSIPSGPEALLNPPLYVHTLFSLFPPAYPRTGTPSQVYRF